MTAAVKTSTITIDWGEHDLPESKRRSWLPSWVVSADGEEGEFLYDGIGGTTTTHEVPENALGIRFRWAPQVNEEFPEMRRQWNVLRRLYLFDEQEGSSVNAMEFCS